MKFLSGQHYILDVCIPTEYIMKLENDITQYFNMMDNACEFAGVTILNKSFNKFEPIGFTALYLLAESHMSIHTYPENGYIAIDLYTCGSREMADKATSFIKDFFIQLGNGETNVKTSVIERGV